MNNMKQIYKGIPKRCKCMLKMVGRAKDQISSEPMYLVIYWNFKHEFLIIFTVETRIFWGACSSRGSFKSGEAGGDKATDRGAPTETSS